MGAGKDERVYSDCSKQVQDHPQHSLERPLPLEGVSAGRGDGWQQYLLGLLPKAHIASSHSIDAAPSSPELHQRLQEKNVERAGGSWEGVTQDLNWELSKGLALEHRACVSA